MIGHSTSSHPGPDLEFETGGQAQPRILDAIGGFFRSLDWAMAFSRRCEAELRAGRVIDEAVLKRIMAELPGSESIRRA